MNFYGICAGKMSWWYEDRHTLSLSVHQNVGDFCVTFMSNGDIRR